MCGHLPISDKCLFAHTFECFPVFVCVATGCCWDSDRVHLSLITHSFWAKQAPLPPLSPPFSFIYCISFSFFSPPCLLESADGMFLQKVKDAHTHKPMRVLLSYGLLTRARCVVLYKGCICLVRIDSPNSLPKFTFFPLKITSSFYDVASTKVCFFTSFSEL